MTTFDQWAGAAVDVDVDGFRIAAHDVGSQIAGAPVVTFLHGYPSSSLDVVPLLERLAGVRVVAPDLPGFGASAKPVGHPYSIHGATDAVEAMWQQLGVTRTLVVAHDYSVSVAQELLARRADAGGDTPVDLTGVVWTNGGIIPALHRQSLGQQLLLDPDHGAEVAAAMDEAAFANGVRGTWGTRRPMTDEELHEMWRSMEHDGGARQAHRLLHYVADRLEHRDRWAAAIEHCPLPMRFCWGELDPVSGAHMADGLVERIPGLTIERLADVGHWPPLEAPDELAAHTRALLE